MKDYLLLFRGGLDFSTATPEQLQQAMMKWRNWIAELTKDARYNGGNRLENNGTVIKGVKKQIFDGPHTESKEIVGGYISIKAGDKQEAIEIAKGCPIFNYDGIVEVREVAKM
ncbi:MAG: YciI family protein [Bacteroidota bacterium]|nr:YciI family protein [Bacteroidota bacterium]